VILGFGAPIRIYDARNSDPSAASVRLEDVLGPLARGLGNSLRNAPYGDARFVFLDRECAARRPVAKAPPTQMVWAWWRIIESGGRVASHCRIDEIGRRRRHLIAAFEPRSAFSPTTMARVLRFAGAARLLRRRLSLDPSVTHDCGYYDRSHLTRHFRAFAGVPPGQLATGALPDNGGIVAD
jgi:hypothetical protein